MESTPVRVLMVDDNEDDYVTMRDLLSEIESQRYELGWVFTYDTGLDSIGRNQHDVYLIDYYLGERNGLQLLRDALTLGRHVPMILLTGQRDRDVDIEAMKAGAADYLVKGEMDATLLERSIRYAVERSRAEKQRTILEEQLRQAQKMEAVGQLAGGIAHDFNNLLTGILGYTQLGGAEADRGRQQTYFEEIRKCAQRAADLTRQLLAFSRRQGIERRILSVNQLIVSTHKMLRRLIGTNIELVTMPSPDLGQVRADPGQLEQVLINLAVNARDAILGGGKLTIETGNVALDQDYASQHPDVVPGSYVMLAVSDNGMGMKEDVKARIFEPFFTTKELGKGTGLGLSTCYGIVLQHGGSISVNSEPGKGRTFRIYLPRVNAVIRDRPYDEVSDTFSLEEGKQCCWSKTRRL